MMGTDNGLFFLFWAVTAVPDGLKAWEVLKGRPHNIDLILTEVDLPSISGFALLTLVMEHDICKNIPVISMIQQGLTYLYITSLFPNIILTSYMVSFFIFVIMQWCLLRTQLVQFINAWWEELLIILLSL